MTLKTLTSVGVLTKADRVQEGDHEYWLRVLNKELHSLRRGYFVTRLQGPAERQGNQTWEESRIREAKLLFNQPWCNAEKRYLGIKNLGNALGETLEEMIKARYELLGKT